MYQPPLLHLACVISLENNGFFFYDKIRECNKNTYYVDSSHAALSEHFSANILNIDYFFLVLDIYFRVQTSQVPEACKIRI